MGLAAGSAQGFSKLSETRRISPESSPTVPSATALPVLAILDPVDLSVEQSLPQPGHVLRSAAGRSARFQVCSGLEIARKLMDFDWNGGRPCHEFQCAFDAGNILMADYILYGSLTPLKGIHAFSFNILDTRSGKVVHSTVGHVPRQSRDSGGAVLRSHLAEFAGGLDPQGFRKPERPTRGVIALVDLGEESTESRVLIERLGTRIEAIRSHDLMSQVELRELLAAMDLPLPASAASDSGMIELGSRLKVAYLMASDLGRMNEGLRLELALFDIAGKRRVHGWSSRPSGEYLDILETESRAFRTLEEMTRSGWNGGRTEAARGTGFPWVRSLLTVAGLAAAGGMGTLAYALHEEADQAYQEAEASMSPQASRSWKRKTEEKDFGAVLFGSLAALTFTASVTLWAF